MFSVTDEVDNHVLVVLLSVLGCEFEDSRHVFNAVSIHVEYGSVNCFSQVTAVLTSSALVGGCCEPNLVIHNNVDSSAYVVRW